MKKVILIIVTFLIIVVVGVLLLKSKKNNNNYSKELNELINKKINYDKLLEVEYSNSGDMNGNVDTIEIENETLILKTRYRSEMGEPISVKEYHIKEKEFSKLESMIKKYNLPAWSYLEFDDNRFAYDAPTTILRFTYDNSRLHGDKYKIYSINYYYNIPTDGYELLHEVTEYMNKLIDMNNLFNEYEEEDN